MSYVVYVKWGSKRPDFALVVNLSNCKKHCFSLWSSGESIKTILDNEKKFLHFLEHLPEVAIVDYKKFIDYFGVVKSPDVYDIYYHDHNEIMLNIKKDYNNGLLFRDWQKIRAESSEAYSNIEDRGVIYEYKKVYPKYSNDVFSGRSKTVGFNIQGTNKNFDIMHSDPRLNIFLTFDWLSADARIAAILSEDDNLLNCFNDSDPYSYIAEALNNKVSRESCKSEWNKAVNSLDCNNGIFKLFPKFSKWFSNQVETMNRIGYTESILGRRFYTDGTYKQNKRAINSIFQGSVAHAMNNSVARIESEIKSILTEQHDSITISSSEHIVNKHVKLVSDIIYRPLSPYLDITMPFRIGIGKSWGSYKYFKECR